MIGNVNLIVMCLYYNCNCVIVIIVIVCILYIYQERIYGGAVGL